MSQRIRYIKATTGYESVKMLKNAEGQELRATLSEDQLTGMVMLGTEVLATVSGTSPHKTKIAVKKALEKVGVSFNSEKRKPRKNEAV